jgi:endonuclease-3
VCAISTRATSASTEKQDIHLLVARLKAAYPDASCALRHENPFQLLIATILSAQCTDERVNKVTPALFARFPGPGAMQDAATSALEDLIRTTGFYHNKTKSIQGASRRIMEAFEGEVPSRMEDLLTLPGVARKTANVVLGVGYRIADGIVVDTHVYRVSHRLGLTRAKTVAQAEQDLMKIVPRAEWIHFAHLLIFHGRRICVARNPRCGVCPVQDLCPSAPIFLSGKIPAREAARRAKPRLKLKSKPKAKLAPRKAKGRKAAPRKARRR